MGILTTILFILFIATCLALIFFVLIQDEAGDSMGAMFGGGNSGSSFSGGASKTLVRITRIIGIGFFILALSTLLVTRSNNKSGVFSEAKALQTGNEWYVTDEADALPPLETGEASTADETANE